MKSTLFLILIFLLTLQAKTLDKLREKDMPKVKFAIDPEPTENGLGHGWAVGESNWKKGMKFNKYVHPKRGSLTSQGIIAKAGREIIFKTSMQNYILDDAALEKFEKTVGKDIKKLLQSSETEKLSISGYWILADFNEKYYIIHIDSISLLEKSNK